MRFPDRLVLEFLDGRDWEVTRKFRYFSKHGGFVVPAGFVTDFASIPRFFWRILPPTGKYGKAAVIHDFLYRTRRVPRATADRVFLEAMTELQVNWLVRQTMYRAVRMFGCAAYSGKEPK